MSDTDRSPGPAFFSTHRDTLALIAGPIYAGLRGDARTPLLDAENLAAAAVTEAATVLRELLARGDSRPSLRNERSGAADVQLPRDRGLTKTDDAR